MPNKKHHTPSNRPQGKRRGHQRPESRGATLGRPWRQEWGGTSREEGDGRLLTFCDLFLISRMLTRSNLLFYMGVGDVRDGVAFQSLVERLSAPRFWSGFSYLWRAGHRWFQNRISQDVGMLRTIWVGGESRDFRNVSHKL